MLPDDSKIDVNVRRYAKARQAWYDAGSEVEKLHRQEELRLAAGLLCAIVEYAWSPDLHEGVQPSSEYQRILDTAIAARRAIEESLGMADRTVADAFIAWFESVEAEKP